MFEAPSSPRLVVPPGGCDSHVHLFGPFARYPLDARRLYTPDPALASDLFAMLDSTGLARAVLVQPSAYGTDNRCMLDALAAHPDRLRGVAVIDAATPQAELTRMHALGVRGTRLNLASSGGRSADETARLVEAMAARIAPLGWHLQMFISLETIAAIAPLVRQLPVDVVFDHMGLAQAAHGPAQPGFAALLDLLHSGRVWVKLSGPYRLCDDLYGTPQVAALARALVAANRDRLVWGSDWPHIGQHPHHTDDAAPHVDYRRIDYGRLLAMLAEWAEADDVARILAANAARLYGFG